MTFGKDPRTYDLAARILNEEIEHEAWFIELLAYERDGKSHSLRPLPPRRTGSCALQQEPVFLYWKLTTPAPLAARVEGGDPPPSE